MRQSFMTVALRVIKGMTNEVTSFVVDDVWERIPDDTDVDDKRVMGAAIRAAREKGWIAPTGTYQLSRQPKCHRNPRQVWAVL